MARPRSPFMDAPPIPCASVAPGRIHWYEIPAHWYAGGRSTSRECSGRVARPDPERSAYRSRRDALDAAGWLWLASRGRWVRSDTGKDLYFRQGMWTLTLPEPAPEPAARRALSSFLNWAGKRAGLERYLWVAELTKRGRVHFHILVNDFLPVNPVRWAWLRALHREGIALDVHEPPRALVEVVAASSSGEARGYLSKYIGKDFGDRAEQLAHRMRELPEVGAGLLERGVPVDELGPMLVDFRVELEQRQREAIAAPASVRRRWGASNDLERKPLQIVGADDPRTLALIHGEVGRMDGVRWGERTDKGQACFFDLSLVTPENCPALYLALHDAAPSPAHAPAHYARG